MEPTAFYSSTSGTYFPDEASLKEHYQSDLHRYNLKRKVAGLPPVSKEWFNSRKEQLTLSGSTTEVQKVYYDPLTGKKFNSKNTYLAAVSSKKYKDAVRKSGAPAPDPIVSMSNQPPPPASARTHSRSASQAAPMADAAVKATAAPLSLANSGRPSQTNTDHRQDAGTGASGSENDDGSCWESASDEDIEDTELAAAEERQAASANGQTGAGMENADADAAAPDRLGDSSTWEKWDVRASSRSLFDGDASTWEEWDVRRSLFDNHLCDSLETNLDYMFKKFGFYLPDADYLSDPEGLIKYLGAKLQYGHTPVGTRGDDASSRQFQSLHAVQRHMVDRNICRLAYEDNEDEYDDFYDYDALDAKLAEQNQQLALQGGSGDASARLDAGGMELSLPAGGEGTGPRRVLGNRSFAMYYRQRHPVAETRQSVAVNAVLARYRALNIALQTPTVEAPVKHAQRARRRYDKAEQAAVVKDVLNSTRRQVQGPAAKQR